MNLMQIISFLTCIFALTSNEYFLHISTNTNIELLFIDKWGRKTGVNPTQANAPYQEIPRSKYGRENQGTSKDCNELSITFIYPDDPGNYTIELFGNSTDNYNLECKINASTGFQKCNFSIKSFLNINGQQKYFITYSENKSVAVTIKKEMLNSTLLQDLTPAISLGHIGDASFGTTLVNKANQIKGALDIGDLNKAKIYYRSISTWIEGAYLNQSTTQFIDEYAYTVLKEDLEFIRLKVGSPIIEQKK